ncbi:MAG: ABC transporter permease subunit [Longimicrobiales bacterium]|nr:ABC transporter permease subunit [Longimicrobiales bacterium]
MQKENLRRPATVNWQDIWILYRRELRSAFRERTIVANSILMPIFLYPVMLWVMFTAMMFVSGLADRATSRIMLVDAPSGHAVLMDTLENRSNLDILAAVGSDSAVALIQAGELDALLTFLPPDTEGDRFAENFRIVIHYDRAVERSRRASDRIEGIVDDYRDAWVDSEAAQLGIAATDRGQFRILQDNVSSGEDMGALLLGIMIPSFLVLMVALGCLVPAIDSTAGERERSTWETLMTVSASRLSIVTAKYLYVATLGITAGVLNVTAMFVSLGAVMGPLLAGVGAEFQFSLPFLALPVMIVAAVALALFFAAAMMILAAFARSFKDGQAMAQPVVLLALLPMVLGQQTDQTLTPTIAAIPVANAAMMIRDAINGVFLWPLIAETLAVLLVMVALCLLLARAVLQFEDLLLGSYDGSFWRFAKERLINRNGSEPTARAEQGVV